MTMPPTSMTRIFIGLDRDDERAMEVLEVHDMVVRDALKATGGPL